MGAGMCFLVFDSVISSVTALKRGLKFVLRWWSSISRQCVQHRGLLHTAGVCDTYFVSLCVSKTLLATARMQFSNWPSKGSCRLVWTVLWFHKPEILKSIFLRVSVTEFLNFHYSFKGGFHRIHECRLHEWDVYSLLNQPLKIIKNIYNAMLFLSNIKRTSMSLCVISVHLVLDNLVQESMNLMQYW